MTNKPLTFLCAGSSSQDVYLRNIDDLTPVCANPEDCFYNVHLGDKIYVNKVDFRTGGGASNAAVTFARQGQTVFYMGLLGCDPAASACVADLSREGISTKYVSYTKRHNTDYSTLLLAPNGERSILTYRGCGSNIQPQHFDLSKIKESVDWLYLTSMVGHFDILKQIMEQASERSIKIAFNPGGAELSQPDKLKPLLKYVHILSVNKQEAQQLVSGDTLEELLAKLIKYCPVVLITDGVHGSVGADPKGAVQAGIYHPDRQSIDRTGAGDAFCSGFTLQYAMGKSLQESIKYASANSASVIMKIGAKTGVLGIEDEITESMDIKPLTL